MLQKAIGVGLYVNLVCVADDGEPLEMADGIGVVRETSFNEEKSCDPISFAVACCMAASCSGL